MSVKMSVKCKVESVKLDGVNLVFGFPFFIFLVFLSFSTRSHFANLTREKYLPNHEIHEAHEIGMARSTNFLYREGL